MIEKRKWGKLPEVHVLVCGNKRPSDSPKGSCAAKGGMELFEAFKEEVEARNLRGRVQINSTNCLKPCGFGPTVVVYPMGAWYGRVQPSDVPEILEAALKGKPVERLQLPPEALETF